MFETERLMLRPLMDTDIDILFEIHGDDEIMYAYNGGFTLEKTKEWLVKQQQHFRRNKLGLYAVCLKSTNQVIGQCGLTDQIWKEKSITEIGYIFHKEFWGNGYCNEVAKFWIDYAFNQLQLTEVYAIIRTSNRSSIAVAKGVNMQLVDTGIRNYRGVDIEHYLFKIEVEHASV